MIDVAPRQLDTAVPLERGWNRDDVRHPLWEQHLRKCYLCECSITVAEFEVDHRIPQAECGALQLCWFNLFPACRSCNGRRGGFPKQGGLLSPGLDGDIETRIQQRIERLSSTEIRARFSASNSEDLYATNTALELARIHSPESGTTEPAQAKAMQLLEDIEDHYRTAIHPLELRVLRARQKGRPDRRAEQALCHALARTEPFTMLVRSMIDPELGDLILTADRP